MKFRLLFVFCLLSSKIFSQVNSTDPLLDIAESELKREWEEFKKLNQPPYFISYRLNEIHSASVASSFGSLVNSNVDEGRLLMVDVKVGDYSLDSSHPFAMHNSGGFQDGPYGGGTLPLDNRKEAIQLQMWEATDAAYRSALEIYKALKNAPPTEINKGVDDFSKESPATYIDSALPDFSDLFHKKEWEEKIKKYSAPFLVSSEIVNSSASLEVGTERKYFISTEGARVVQNRLYAFLSIVASIRAEDGDIIPLHISYFGFTTKDLPNDDVILKDVQNMIVKLEALRKAPVAEPYTGPAILHAKAAGVFFHEIFGHRVEGHRLKNEHDSQTFKSKVDQLILPKNLSVVFDPTLTHYKGQPLNGTYLYDDEGVKGQKVKVVEDGVLKTFLMSRAPMENFTKSNGHGRSQAGNVPVTRQSNLIIENKKEVQMSDLRKLLISECKKEKRKYGYLFMDVMGGFTTTDRDMPNAFNIFPTEVYRVYVDGRPDELVRGVDLIGTPLAMFAGITAADGKNEVFTGFCGAESGSVPVTAISPSLYVKRIETQRKSKMESEKTLLERPQQKTSNATQH